MYRVNYYEREKDLTYDDAYYSVLDNENHKWENYYTYLKEKYDLCYNVESITIDVEDIEKMQFECFSNGILLKLFLKCANENILRKYDQVTIMNDGIFNEELIYNIFKTEWLIDEELFKNDQDELKRRKNYFAALLDASEQRQDIKIQFRNKLLKYFLEKYDFLKDNYYDNDNKLKVLKLSKTTNN